jgi:hypothetical protein
MKWGSGRRKILLLPQIELDNFQLYAIIPLVPFAGVAHLVERHLAKVEVASSSLVVRSSSLQVFVCLQRAFLFNGCASFSSFTTRPSKHSTRICVDSCGQI